MAQSSFAARLPRPRFPVVLAHGGENQTFPTWNGGIVAKEALRVTPMETAFWRQLRRLLPLHPPGKGWLYTLQRIEAAQLGGAVTDQAVLAEQMTRLGAHQIRSETTPTWALPAASWRFHQGGEPGAGGAWLDLWGQVYAVGRWANEIDSRYASRILTTVTRPTTTNEGMGIALDEAFGISGTVVQDTYDYLTGPRYNDRTSMYGVTRFGQVPEYPLDWYECTFRVILPDSVVEPPRLRSLVERFKAAGTKLFEVVESGSGAWGYGNLYGLAYGNGSD